MATKKTLIGLLLVLCAMAWAESGIIGESLKGAGLDFNYISTTFNDIDEEGEERASVSNLSVTPGLHFFFVEDTEFVPYLSFGFQWEENSGMTRDGSNAIGDGIYRFTLGGGAGFYWHFFETEKIDLLTGTKLDISYGFKETGKNAPTGETGDPTSIQYQGSLYIPLGLDFNFTPNLTMRVSMQIVRMRYSVEQETQKDADDNDVTETDITAGSYFPFLEDGNSAISLGFIYYWGE